MSSVHLLYIILLRNFPESIEFIAKHVYAMMAEVSSAGDNDAPHLVENKCRSSDIACLKCEELESTLQETLLELRSVKLIIKLLQK